MQRILMTGALLLSITLVSYADKELPVAQKADPNAGPRLRLPSVDVNVVPPLPFLGKPIADRASTADATEEASTRLATSAVMPRRTAPAAFVKIDLPDPFENRKAMRIPLILPPESTEPVVVPVQAMKP